MNMFAGMQTQPPKFNTGNAPQQQQNAFNNGGFGGFQSAPQPNNNNVNGNYYGGLVNLAPSQGANSPGKL